MTTTLLTLVPTPPSDLMAIALTRRLLLELGVEVAPEEGPHAGTQTGPLELWIMTAHPGLDGQTPLEVLATPDGSERLRTLLAVLVSKNRDSEPPDGS